MWIEEKIGYIHLLAIGWVQRSIELDVYKGMWNMAKH
jgi:hypothetical protein